MTKRPTLTLDEELERLKAKYRAADAEAIAEAQARGIVPPKARQRFMWRVNGTEPATFVRVSIRKVGPNDYDRTIVHYLMPDGRRSTIELDNFLGWRGSAILTEEEFQELTNQSSAVEASFSERTSS